MDGVARAALSVFIPPVFDSLRLDSDPGLHRAPHGASYHPQTPREYDGEYVREEEKKPSLYCAVVCAMVCTVRVADAS